MPISPFPLPAAPPSLAEPRGYSNGVTYSAGGSVVFLAGQIG